MYTLILAMNNETLEYETEDLKKSLLEFTPEQVYTEVYITIKKGETEFVRKFNLTEAKRLFRDVEALDIFLNTYTSLYE